MGERIVTWLKMFLGLEDVRKPIPLIKSLVSEMIWTMHLIIVGCSYGCTVGSNWRAKEWGLSLGFGWATMAAVYYSRHISGGRYVLMLV